MSATDRRVAGVNGFVAAAAPRSVVDRLVDAVGPVVALALGVQMHALVVDLLGRVVAPRHDLSPPDSLSM